MLQQHQIGGKAGPGEWGVGDKRALKGQGTLCVCVCVWLCDDSRKMVQEC